MLSIIIPFSADSECRTRNLEEVLKCLKNQQFQDFETVLAEEAYRGDYAGGEFDVDNHVRVKNTLRDRINPSWEMNVGARQAKGDRYLFLDADLVFDKSYIGKVSSLDHEFCWAWSRIHKLTKVGREKYLKGAELSGLKELTHRVMNPSPMDAARGSLFIRKQFFWRTGGFNENFFYWGRTDNEFLTRVNHLGSTNRMDYDLYHLHHPRTASSKKILQMNTHLLNVTKKQTEKVIEKLRKASLGKGSNPTVIQNI